MMRKPAAETDLIDTSNLKLVPLDVQDPVSAKRRIRPDRAASRDQFQRQYDVNVFGLIECVQAIAPHSASSGPAC
jgi:NAD(P)-dependent dehydrogenase (short-subunit alcohol dehydrogenase family)